MDKSFSLAQLRTNALVRSRFYVQSVSKMYKNRQKRSKDVLYKANPFSFYKTKTTDQNYRRLESSQDNASLIHWATFLFHPCRVLGNFRKFSDKHRNISRIIIFPLLLHQLQHPWKQMYSDKQVNNDLLLISDRVSFPETVDSGSIQDWIEPKDKKLVFTARDVFRGGIGP